VAAQDYQSDHSQPLTSLKPTNGKSHHCLSNRSTMHHDSRRIVRKIEAKHTPQTWTKNITHHDSSKHVF